MVVVNVGEIGFLSLKDELEEDERSRGVDGELDEAYIGNREYSPRDMVARQYML